MGWLVKMTTTVRKRVSKIRINNSVKCTKRALIGYNEHNFIIS